MDSRWVVEQRRREREEGKRRREEEEILIHIVVAETLVSASFGDSQDIVMSGCFMYCCCR